MTSTVPEWVGETVQETIQQAQQTSVDDDAVVRWLKEERFSDVDERRVRAIVEAELPATDKDPSTASSVSDSTAEPPREIPPRYFDVVDAAYVSDRELARVLASALERWEGSATLLRDEPEVVADIAWNRSHTTTAIRTVSRDRDTPVEATTIQTVLGGQCVPSSTRNPSTTAVVTNGRFTDEAMELADEGDIVLVDETRLQWWFECFQLDPNLYGPVLEEGELANADLSDLFEDVLVQPPGSDGIDLLEPTDVVPWRLPPERDVTLSSVASSSSSGATTSSTGGRTESSGWSETTNTSASSTTQSSSDARVPEDDPTEAFAPDRSEGMPVRDPKIETGEYGKLYADPDEDGDFDDMNELIDSMEDE